MFVLLELEPDGKAIGSDGLDQFSAGKGSMIDGNRLEHVALLIDLQWVDPRE